MRFRSNGGYSLIELMIVVVIIGILAALIIPKFLDSTRKAKEAEGKMLAKSAYKMLHSYVLEHDACPANLPATGFPEVNGKYYRLISLCFATNFYVIIAFPLDATLGLQTWIVLQDGSLF